MYFRRNHQQMYLYQNLSNVAKDESCELLWNKNFQLKKYHTIRKLDKAIQQIKEFS